MSAHTPGPWYVELDVADDGDIGVFTAAMAPIAIVDVRDDPGDDDAPAREVALANGHLLAAAPDLLKAAKAASEWWSGYQAEPPWPWLKGLREAIAKAEGNA